MENTLTIQNWVEEAKEHINSNNLYVDSWHIDDLVECSKKEWISKSIKTYDIINSIIKERKHENTVCLLVIYLNRKRKSNTLVSKLEYDEISKQDTPPELYLISSNNVIYKEWLSSLMKVCVDGYENYITLYGEFWCSGFDRYLWFVPSGLKVDSTFKCN